MTAAGEGRAPVDDAGSRSDDGASSASPTWMQASGVVVFATVLVLLSFVLPPMFDTSSNGSRGHAPPAGDPAPPAGGHRPPAGGHGPTP